MKFIYLTGLRKELNEVAQKRLDDWEGESYEEAVDSDGRSREYFENLGIKVPKEITDKEKNLDDDITFTDEDYDEFEVDVVINIEDFSMSIDTTEDTATIYLKNGMFVNTLENSSEINGQIWWITRTPWEKIQNYWKELINKFKIKK